MYNAKTLLDLLRMIVIIGKLSRDCCTCYISNCLLIWLPQNKRALQSLRRINSEMSLVNKQLLNFAFRKQCCLGLQKKSKIAKQQ